MLRLPGFPYNLFRFQIGCEFPAEHEEPVGQAVHIFQYHFINGFFCQLQGDNQSLGSSADSSAQVAV